MSSLVVPLVLARRAACSRSSCRLSSLPAVCPRWLSRLSSLVAPLVLARRAACPRPSSRLFSFVVPLVLARRAACPRLSCRLSSLVVPLVLICCAACPGEERRELPGQLQALCGRQPTIEMPAASTAVTNLPVLRLGRYLATAYEPDRITSGPSTVGSTEVALARVRTWPYRSRGA